MTEQAIGYEHRQMRCKLDRIVKISGRRYRPGELIEGEVPPEHAEDFEPAVITQAPPVPEATGQRVKKIRHEPPVIVQRELPPVRPSAPASPRWKGLDKPNSEQDD